MNKETLMELYLGKSLSTYEIAKIAGVHNTTVYSWLKKYDIPIRDKTDAWKTRKRPEWVDQLPELVKTMNAQDIANQVGEKYATVQYHIKKLGLVGKRVSDGMLERRAVCRQRYTKEELFQLYHTEQKTMKAIGELYGVTAATVLADLRRFEIPSRTKAEASNISWDNDEKREAARIRAINRPALEFGQKTDIELMFEEWAKENNVEVEAQYQISDNGHRYDYLITGTTILVELDGDYWHSTERQQKLDRRFEEEAKEAGFIVTRYLRSDLLKDKNLFNDILKGNHQKSVGK